MPACCRQSPLKGHFPNASSLKDIGDLLIMKFGIHHLIALLVGVVGVATAAEIRPLMRDFIGINGHTVQFKPELYRPVTALVRDYHPVEWDLAKETSVLPDLPFAKNRVDWSQVYGSWKKQDWTIDACLMFESVPRGDWSDLVADAKAYGEAIAREFGPSGNRKLLESVEIGNEPGKWSDTDYSQIFKAMAEGIRAGDPKLKIATCNMTTGKSGDYEKSVDCLKGFTEIFDVLSIHSYAQLEGWPTWRRSFPEDPALKHHLPDVRALCNWRDEHAPNKPVWITEFGYDSTTQPNAKSGDFEKWQGVSDVQQAQWLVRSLLVFSAMPVQRAYVYFFNDEDQPSLHASAGITRHFQPKPSYHALAHLQKMLGDFRFQKVITDQVGRLRIQQYQDDDGTIIWAVWSPTGNGNQFSTTLENLPGELISLQRMPLNDGSPAPLALPPTVSGTLEIQVDENPLYLVFKAR